MLLLLPLAVASLDVETRRYMGFYASELVETWAKGGSRSAGLQNFSSWMNLISSVNASFLAEAKTKHGGFVTLLNTKWMFFYHPTGAANTKFLLQVPAPVLQQRLAAIQPLVANGSVDGIDFGDELVAPFSNISAVVRAAREALGPRALLYMNEGADVFTGGTAASGSSPVPALCAKVLRKGCADLCGTPSCCWWPHVPPELDLVGFDMYEPTGPAEVAAVRAYATACVYPSMHPAQRFVAVPGCFAQHNNKTTPALVAQEDAAVAAKVDDYATWVAADARVGGVKPWHWDDRAMTEDDGMFWLGAQSLPKTRDRLAALGRALIGSAGQETARVKSDDDDDVDDDDDDDDDDGGGVSAAVHVDVVIDMAKPTGRNVTHSASGFLNSMPAEPYLDTVVRPLKLRNYRGLGVSPAKCDGGGTSPAHCAAGKWDPIYPVLQNLSSVANAQVLLFEEWCWHYAPGAQADPTNWSASQCNTPVGDYANLPGANGNWTSWEDYIRGAVQRKHATETLAGPRIWWEIWNEPNGGGPGAFWPLGICNFTQCLPDPRFKELWRRAVRLLRAIDSTAIIVGPSPDAMDWGYLSSFLLFARDDGVMPDIINWHELTPGSNGSEIPEHHVQMRAWLAANRMNDTLPIAHNELVPATAHLIPAQTLGAIAGADAAGAVGCTHSNWGPTAPCTHDGYADGLLTCDEGPDHPGHLPRAVWWVFRKYADTAGVQLPVERHCDDCAALGSYDSTSGVARLLIGYYNGQTCDRATGRCTDLPAPASRFLTVRMLGLGAVIHQHRQARTTHALVEEIPNAGVRYVVAPVLLSDGPVALAADGSLTLRLNASLNGVLSVVLSFIPTQ